MAIHEIRQTVRDAKKVAKLDDNESRIKGYIEQRHALHEAKRILHEAGKYEGYRADEMDTVETMI